LDEWLEDVLWLKICDQFICYDLFYWLRIGFFCNPYSFWSTRKKKMDSCMCYLLNYQLRCNLSITKTWKNIICSYSYAVSTRGCSSWQNHLRLLHDVRLCAKKVSHSTCNRLVNKWRYSWNLNNVILWIYQ
jgi:hypothetical protein